MILPPWKLIFTITEIDFYHPGVFILFIFFLPWKFNQSNGVIQKM